MVDANSLAYRERGMTLYLDLQDLYSLTTIH